MSAPSAVTDATCAGHAVALARYERCKVGHVLAVNCPMDCLLKFVELQNRMNAVEENDSAAGAEATGQDAIAQAVDAASALDPGLQELYAQKFGKSIQDDIKDAASGAGSGKAPPPSPAAQKELAALSSELGSYWEEKAVTHGNEASGGGRELFRVFCHAIFKVRARRRRPLDPSFRPHAVAHSCVLRRTCR